MQPIGVPSGLLLASKYFEPEVRSERRGGLVSPKCFACGPVLGKFWAVQSSSVGGFDKLGESKATLIAIPEL